MNSTDVTLIFIAMIILMAVFRLSFLPPLVRILLSLIAMGISVYVIVRAIQELEDRRK